MTDPITYEFESEAAFMKYCLDPWNSGTSSVDRPNGTELLKNYMNSKKPLDIIKGIGIR